MISINETSNNEGKVRQQILCKDLIRPLFRSPARWCQDDDGNDNVYDNDDDGDDDHDHNHLRTAVDDDSYRDDGDEMTIMIMKWNLSGSFLDILRNCGIRILH